MIVARYVTGLVSRARRGVRLFLLLVYVIVPWIPWGGRPMVLLDIAERKFYFPGIVIWPQEFYFLWVLLLAAGVSLFLFTSLFGRLWCGWACPQTVYTEMFDTIGRWIMPNKFGKKSETWVHRTIVQIVWVLLSALITFHFIGYFVGVRNMLNDLASSGPAVFTGRAWPYFWIASTALFYFDLGYFREQFCVYLCPYARFQSVMLDRNSVIVAYDKSRGEPRREKGRDPASGPHGDCTGCTLCTLVCPTGIDIRNGLQVACINCGHCIDACTGEMARHGKPTLVGYGSLRHFEERQKTKLVRPRTVVYAAAWLVLVSVFTFLLARRVPIYLSVLRDRKIQPVLVDGMAQNYYEIDLGNLRESSASVAIEAKLLDESADIGAFESLVAENPAKLHPNELRPIRLVLRAKANEKHAKKTLRVQFTVRDTGRPDQFVQRTSIFTVPET